MNLNDFLSWAGSAVMLTGKILLVCFLVELIVIAVGVIAATVKAMTKNVLKKKKEDEGE